MKLRVTIDLDTDTKRAFVTVGDRKPVEWTDCDAHWSKAMSEITEDGWIKHTATGERSFTLFGTVKE